MGQAIETDGPLGRNKSKRKQHFTSDEVDSGRVLKDSRENQVTGSEANAANYFYAVPKADSICFATLLSEIRIS